MAKELTEEQRKESRKETTMYMSIATGLLTAYLFGYIGYNVSAQSCGVIDGLVTTLDLIKSSNFFYGINAGSIFGNLLGVLGGFIYYYYDNLHYERFGSYKQDEVAGSSRFMNKKEIAEYTKTYIGDVKPEKRKNTNVAKEKDTADEFSYLIMNNDFYRPVNSRSLIGNNNVLIVGGAGTGKSRFFIKPNVLQLNCSYIITDPSGEIIYSLGKVLQDNGYKIKVFNISDMEYSNHYNPLEYIRNEAGVNMLIDTFIRNTTKEGSKGDAFFENAEKLLYSACIFYLINHCDDVSKKTFATVLNMINSSAVDENGPINGVEQKSPLDLLFEELPEDSLAWKNYKAFKQAAGKTLKSIIISCVVRLQPFFTPQVANLTQTDDLELDKMGDEKTALFIITPQADRTYAFLASMLYSQLFEVLYYKGEKQKAAGMSEQLKVPVRCLMDEFANIGEVPEFPSKLSTMRKYNISATVVLQDISQIKAMYKDQWNTLTANCSTTVFLGTQEPETLEYFSKMLGKTTIKTKSRGMSQGKSKGSSQNFQNTGRELMFPDELARMPSDECIVFTQNMRPVKGKKYKYHKHPNFRFTADADDSLGYKYMENKNFQTNLIPLDGILKATAEAERVKMQEIVPDSRSTKDAKIEQSVEDGVKSFTFSPEKEKKLQIDYISEIVNGLNVEGSSQVGYYLLDIPYDRLYAIGLGAYDLIGDSPNYKIILVLTKKSNLYSGYAFSGAIELLKILNGTSANQISEIEKNKKMNCCKFRIHKHKFENFLKELDSKIEEL